jgi:NADPH:quinone reductase-like Zn-dependent oxidoreductase
MTTVSTYIRVSRLEEALPHRHLSVGKSPEPTIHRFEVAPATKQHNKTKQSALLLKGIGEKYTLVANHDIPTISHKDEILVKIMAIGLNPIDWKGPAYNFGIPSLPWINGRDLAGEVIQVSDSCSRLRVGDIVLVPSTDYRDMRKAAFQEYAVATHFNAARIPPAGNIHTCASLGVAFVAAALALGVSFGLNFGRIRKCPGPDLPGALMQIDRKELPTDITDECFRSSSKAERIMPGDWLVVWGGELSPSR